MPDFDKLKHHTDKLQSLLNDRQRPGLPVWVVSAAKHWQAIAKMWSDEEFSWSEDWPTEPGYYWFYGWTHGYWRGDPARLHFVEIHKLPLELMFFTDGKLFRNADGAEGFWMPAGVPEAPVQLTGGEHHG